ncbi:MAG: hypothetical protein LDLANPLL_01586 [Turneriella sp.]|nr:hypothetical protein [Turneriella sp.]
MQRRQAGGGIATSLATAGFQTIAQTGAAFATGGNGWGTLVMGVIQGAGAFAGSFLGGLDYGLGKIGNAITGVAAQQTVNYGMSGFQMDPNNGNISYKGPSRGAGMSALVQGAFGMLGAGMNAGYGIRGTPASTVSTTFNAVGAGIQFNDDGSLQKNYNWAKAGTSFAANMASTVASGYAGNFAKSDLVGTQVGRLANTITEAALGNQGAWNAYQPQGIFNTLGTYAGGELAKAVNNRNTAPDKVPVDQQPFRELLGGGAIIATRRREDNQDEDVLGGILEGFKTIGKAGYDAGAATAGAFSAAANWTTQNILNPIGNALSSAASAVGSTLKTIALETGAFFKEQIGQRLANLIEHGSLRTNAGLAKHTVDSALDMTDPNAAMEYLIAAKEKGIIGAKEMAEVRNRLLSRASDAKREEESVAILRTTLGGQPDTGASHGLLKSTRYELEKKRTAFLKLLEEENARETKRTIPGAGFTHVGQKNVTLADGSVVDNHGGDVTIVESDRKAQKDFWAIVGSNQYHYSPKSDDKKSGAYAAYKTDLGVGKHGEFYAPNVEFQVLDYGHHKDWGSFVKIQYQDENGDSRSLYLAHLTDISKTIVDAKGTGNNLPAGTFMGFAKRPFGLSDGPHVHVTSEDKNYDRYDYLPMLKYGRKYADR